MNFYRLTRPDGQPLWIGDNGTTIDRPLPGSTTAATRITIGGVAHFVTEEIDEVVRRLQSDPAAR
jgi:hypothetical protein